MRILLINGSPRREQSSTLRVSKAFLEGVRGDGDVVDSIDIEKSNIRGCLGCFTCWYKTPGVCVFKDDMPALFRDHFLKADLVVWSFPLYFYSLPAKLKAFMDRTFVNDCPDMVTDGKGRPTHPLRHDTSHMRHVIVSTCGFYTSEGLYDAVHAQFRLAYGDAYAASVICAEGGVFMNPRCDDVVLPYLEKVKAAGREFAQQGRFSDATTAALAVPPLPPDVYMQRANSRPGTSYALDHSAEGV